MFIKFEPKILYKTSQSNKLLLELLVDLKFYTTGLEEKIKFQQSWIVFGELTSA